MHKILWLRISYWVGAILDFLVAIAMVSPSIFASVYKLPDINLGIECKIAFGMGASLMLGWTFLLIWADRKPIERKGILVITMFPALTGLVITEIYAVVNNFISFSNMIPTWIIQAILFALFTFSYINAKIDDQSES